VIIHGPLQQDALARIRSRCRALLYPLEPIIPHSELFSLAILEACAAGVPPVLAPVDALTSVYASVGRFVDDYDAQAWVQAVEDVIADEDAGQRVRQFAARRTWNDFRDDWLSLFTKLKQKPARTNPESDDDRHPWVFIAFGVGGGEVALARPVIEEAVRRRQQVLALTNRPTLTKLLEGVCNTHTVSSSGEFVDALPSHPGLFVFSCTATCLPLIQLTAQHHPSVPRSAIEFSWLVREARHPAVQAIDKWFHALPQAAWQGAVASGLFDVPIHVQKLTMGAGPLYSPPVETYGEEPHLLLYFGASPADWLRPQEAALVDALEAVRSRIPGLSALYVHGDHPLRLPPWVKLRERLPFESFAREIARAKVVICHPAMATTTQALAYGTHVLLLSSGDSFIPGQEHWGDRETRALVAAGLVEATYGCPSPALLARRIYSLLTAPRPVRLRGGVDRVVDGLEELSGVSQGVWRPDLLVE